MFLDGQSYQLGYGELLSWLVKFGFDCTPTKLVNGFGAYIEDR